MDSTPQCVDGSICVGHPFDSRVKHLLKIHNNHLRQVSCPHAQTWVSYPHEMGRIRGLERRTAPREAPRPRAP